MASIVGFTLARGLTPRRLQAARQAEARALSHVPALGHQAVPVGSSALTIWGHQDLSRRVSRAPDGSIAVLVGSPSGRVAWDEIASGFVDPDRDGDAEIPCDGRVVVVGISGDGRRWDVWTDWVGSIPVFYARLDQGWIASTFEPVVVAAAGFSSSDISLPALLGVLVDGQFLNDSTLFDGMKTVPADCRAVWRDDAFEWSRRWTVVPSSSRWETGWDDLVDEMHRLAVEAVRDSLLQSPRWAVPLSGGLDSRLIAAIGCGLGAEFSAFTWGAPGTTDVACGRHVATRLRLPWHRVDAGKEYLRTEAGHWIDMFGSSMHLHGMFQLACYKRLRAERPDPIVSGYFGDLLSGYALAVLMGANFPEESCQLVSDAYHHWSFAEAVELLRPPAREALAALRLEIAETLRGLPGARYQQAILLNAWNRQRRFTGYSAWIADHERGVATPFLSREYARFCLSLPRAALDGRRLLADVLRRFYPALAAVPGTYGPEPLVLTGRYLLARRLTRLLPPRLGRGSFAYVRSTADLESMRSCGWDGVWPIRETLQQLEAWIDVDKVRRLAERIWAGGGDMRDVRRLQSVQCLAYRVLDAHTTHSGPPPS